MWKPYLRVIAKKASHAVHILDRFHIMSQMSKAIDKVRAQIFSFGFGNFCIFLF